MAEGRTPYSLDLKGWIIAAFVVLLALFAIWWIMQDHYGKEPAAEPPIERTLEGETGSGWQ